MAENLFCEEPNCGDPARVFGFVGGQKRKACQEHSLILIGKQVTLYSIAAFAFMRSPEDAPLYEQRRGQMERGLGALTALETACETTWEEEQKRLQERCEAMHAVVQQSYQEMWLRSQQSYEQMKRDLAAMRSQFEQLLLDHNYQLNPEVADLCEEMPPDHLFCVVTGNSLLPVAETLMTNYQVLVWDMKREKKRNWGQELRQFAENQAGANQFDIAVRVAEHARQFGVEGPDFTNEAIQQSEDVTQQLRCLFSTTTSNEAEECLKAGQTADQTGDFETGLRELQRGRNLLRDSNNWELYLRLSCKMAEINIQRSHYDETLEICLHILSIWTSSAHSLEFLQALFFLVYSYLYLKQNSQALAIEEEWGHKLIAECSACHCVQLCTSGIVFYVSGREEEGIEYIEKALQLEPSSSFITTCSKSLLAQTYKNQCLLEKSDQVYRSALELCIVHFPHSMQYAEFLINLGGRYEDMQRPQEAEEQYIKASQFCSTHFPHSMQYSTCLFNLGNLYHTTQRLQETEEQYIKAIQLYSAHFPHSIEYVRCLSNLGALYETIQRLQAAEDQFIKAIQLCSSHFPYSIEYAKCLFSLGVLYKTMKRYQDAEEQYIEAIQLFSTYFPHSIEYAQSLFKLGMLYQIMQLPEEAEEQYVSAIHFCSTYFTHSIEYVECFINLGALYKDTQRPQEAEEQYMNAIQLCSTDFPHSHNYTVCLFNLGYLYHSMERLQEAEEQYAKAIQLCSIYFPSSLQYSMCLINLGELYRNLQRLPEAEEQLIKAVNLCSTHFPDSIEHAKSLFLLGLLYQSCGIRNEAVTSFEEARRLYVRVGTQKQLDDCDRLLKLLSSG